MTDLIPNALLAYEVLDKIDANPENWNQRRWFDTTRPECGTAMCFAGWTAVLSGDQPLINDCPCGTCSVTVQTVGGDERRVSDRAAELLGIREGQAENLFWSENSRERLGELVAEIFGPDPRGGA